MTQQSEEWARGWGNNYTNRNRVDWRRRMRFWKPMMDTLGARSVLEVGCNVGWNMTGIKQAAPWAEVTGIDINQEAVKRACTAGLDAWLGDTTWRVGINEGLYELVLTVGVLIHIPEPELTAVMRDIIRLSNRWVLAIEYHADQETPVHYRGRDDMLWKRPYGEIYEDLGLKRLDHDFPILDKEWGFDDCTVYLMEKP